MVDHRKVKDEREQNDTEGSGVREVEEGKMTEKRRYGRGKWTGEEDETRKMGQGRMEEGSYENVKPTETRIMKQQPAGEWMKEGQREMLA